MLVLSFLVSSIGLFRLYSKTEQLEQLMGEEVTDINEILAVINNIQVIRSSLQLMYYDIRELSKTLNCLPRRVKHYLVQRWLGRLHSR